MNLPSGEIFTKAGYPLVLHPPHIPTAIAVKTVIAVEAASVCRFILCSLCSVVCLPAWSVRSLGAPWKWVEMEDRQPFPSRCNGPPRCLRPCHAFIISARPRGGKWSASDTPWGPLRRRDFRAKNASHFPWTSSPVPKTAYYSSAHSAIRATVSVLLLVVIDHYISL